RKAVESSRNPYESRVDSQKYYLQHPTEFPSTQPAAQDVLSLGSGGVKHAPTTRPFAQAESEIKDKLINAETDKRVNAILERINTALAADWVTYHNAVGNPT